MKNINTVPPNLKYGYEMTLSLARPGTPFSQEDRQFLEQAIAEYNGKSVYMANPKQINLLEVADSYIKIRLCSTQALTTPGRGLRTLTTILLNDSTSRFADRVTPGGQLFRVININQPTCRDASIDPARISDIDFVKAVLDYIAEKKDGSSACQKKRAAMEEMKKLAVETCIISSVAP